MGQLRARSETEREKRYQNIISVTKKLFQNQNYDDLNLGKIAKELNLSRPALYSYFKSKEELFLEVSKLEYVKMNKKLRNSFTTQLPQDVFCRQFVEVFLSNDLFLKLLSLHQQAMEQKVDYKVMKKFKTETLPFFETLRVIVRQQFPLATQEARELLIQQINLILPTIYNYSHIPIDQKKIMLSLKTFGDKPLLSSNDFFTKLLIQLSQNLQ